MTVPRGWESGVFGGKEGDAGNHERNEPIKRQVQADTAQRKTTRLQKRVTFNAPTSILSKAVSHGRKWKGGERLLDQQNIFWSLWLSGTISLLYRQCLLVILEVFSLLAIKGLTSRDRIDVLKRVMKEGRGVIIPFVNNKLRSSLLEGDRHLLCVIQSIKWMSGIPRCWERLGFYTF